MIKYNNNTIYNWNFDTSNVIKVYRNNAIVFYKVSGESPTPEWKVCFAVVDDISQYTDREFEDVYDKATEKWYKLNNLNQYEKYGVYGSGRTITTYEGKLTIDNGDDGEDYSTHYLTLVAQTDNVSFKYDTATSSNKLQYSLDSGSTWSDLSNGSSTTSVNSGDKVMFKASGLTVNTERGIGRITPSSSATVEGNIMSLAYGDNFSGQTTIANNYQFRKLFSGVTTITSAENMVLPATTVKQQCYSQMFQGCTNLVKTPKTIGSSAMTWSGNYCFSNLFSYCTSLTTVPSGLLPALNLGTQCYWYMFEGCSGLTTAPDLPATTTASQCYQGMFINCSSLNYITVLTTNNFTMNEWLSGVAASGTFVKNPNATWSSCGTNKYPCGWTVQDYVEPTPIKYEYQYSGGSWVNLGEVTGSSRVPSGYVELTYAQTSKVNSSSSNAFTVPIDLQETNNYIYEFTPLNWEESYYGHILGGNDGSTNFPKWGIFKLDNGWGDMTKRFVSAFWNYNLESRSSSLGGNYRVYDNVKSKFTMNLHNYTVGQGADIKVENEGYETVTHTSTTIFKSGYSVTSGVYNIDVFSTSNGNSNYIASEQFHNLKVETNEGVAVYDYIPCKRKSDNEVGLYDVVNNAFYSPSAFTLTAGEEESHTTYPKYYSEKSEPLNDLTFNTLAEAQTYAYNNCVYDGMHAIIGTDRYYFDSTDDNGWVKILEYYKVEDVTPNAASGWTISGSSTYNPDSSYYDDFDLETSWGNYSYKIAKVTIYGYDHFTYYLRSYHGWSSENGYVMATNVDDSNPSSMSYNSPSAITTTYNFNKSPKSDVNLSNYRRVTYNNLDKTVEHTFYVYFYGRTYSSYVGNATILIPKEQTNENWEQVTFSASSNVALTQKNLYIDGNNSSSGGTSCFFNRWIVGLPSGSHSSYVSYSNYNYCPNTTSSTFTSVASEQRQVNFTYEDTSNKTLSFRLTDGNGNVLTPSDTVYYNMTYYNSCGVSSSSSNVTFPRSQSVKVGGGFRFANSSNRHYIYGYSPNISLNTDYYVDNYQSTFDITYTKLSDEAVTITYTTYDPNDVETPAFNTDITWPYSGGTTSSTTLTSFDVPYTYPYEVSQTSNKFSADSQTYTANQAARTINFTLYPNNREFATVADMEAYQYAWEGMKATVGDTKYQYKNGEWVENTHSLPDVPFVLNYNAKEYNASTHTIAMTDGQLNGTDAIAYTNPNNIVDHSSDGYITISNSSMRIRKENQDIALFNRSSNSTSSDLTIVCKAKSTGGENIITNRDSNYNWMYRLKTSGMLTFHGNSETGSLSWNTSNPDIMSVRTYYESGTKVKYNNWTQNTSSIPMSFSYGSTNGDASKAGALFVGYSWSNTSEQWSGDFYWVYMAQANLTDEQIQQVIDYNENL